MPARPGCWPRSDSRRLRRPAAATPLRSAGSTGRSLGKALAHAATIVQATDLPVSADLENAFADDPAGVAETIAFAIAAGLAGCSVEDFSGRAGEPIYEPGLAAQRIRAAA